MRLYCSSRWFLRSVNVVIITSFFALFFFPHTAHSQAKVFSGEYILQTESPLNLRNLDSSSLESTASGTISLVRESGNFRSLGDETIVEYDAKTVQEFCEKAFHDIPHLTHCEPNFHWQIDATSNDPEIPSGMFDIQASDAWNITTGSGAVVVAVTDTGIDHTHVDLQGNIWTNDAEIPGNGIDDDRNGYIDDYYGYDFFNNDGDPYDDNGHGTHVAGTIGAKGNNGLGVVGVSWNVKLMGVKFLSSNGGGSTFAAVRGIDYAVSMGAQVINASWGGPFRSQILETSVQKAIDAGVIVVAAAGNSATDNDGYEHFPSGYPHVISVAATSAEGELASFSNYGQNSVHLAAPGVSVTSTYPGNSYRALSGTSMAAPHVSGAIALMLSENLDASIGQIKSRLLQSADVLPSLSGKVYSAGRLNLYRALSDGEGVVTGRALFISRTPYTSASISKTLRAGKSFYVGFSGTPNASIPASILLAGRTVTECKTTIQLNSQGTNLTAARLPRRGRVRPNAISVSGPSGSAIVAAVKSSKKKSARTNRRSRSDDDCAKLLGSLRS